MKKFTALLLPFIFAISSLTGCGSNNTSTEDSYYFTIKASNSVHYLDDSSDRPVYSVDTDHSRLAYSMDASNLKLEVVYSGTTGAKVNNYKDNVVALYPGTFKVMGYIGDVASKNIITIEARFSSAYIVDRVKKIAKSPVTLGKTYEIGIMPSEVEKYSLDIDADIARLTSEGKLEICGLGTDVNFTLKCDGVGLVSDKLSVESNRLNDKIYETLLAENKINSLNDPISKSLLSEIKSLDFSDELLSDSKGLDSMYLLENLESINISHNSLTSADFLSSVKSLKKVDISYNRLTNLDFLKESANNIEILNASNSNVYLHRNAPLEQFTSIKSLDLSNTSIASLEALAPLTTLESLNLNKTTWNKNEITDYLSGFTSLKELKIGFTNAVLSDIESLPCIDNINSLDLSGSAVDLEALKEHTNIEKLVLQNCNLGSQDFSLFSEFPNLKELDISNNDLYPAKIEELEASSLTHLEKLSIGGNKLSTIPSVVSQLPALKSLDLTESTELLTINGLNGLDLEELIIDECNNLGSSYSNPYSYAPVFLETISSLHSLERLSLVGSLNHVNSELYESLKGLAKNGTIKLRILQREYMTGNEVDELVDGVAFSYSEFVSLTNSRYDTSFNLPNAKRHIILKFVGDTNVFAERTIVYVPKGVERIDIYGDKDAYYNMYTYLMQYKTDSVEVNLRDFADQSPADIGFVKKDPNAFCNLTIKRCINSFVRWGNTSATPENCACDNGWNTSSQDTADWVNELRMDIMIYWVDGTIKQDSSYYISKPEDFKMISRMNHAFNRIPFKDGRDDTRAIDYDSNASSYNIADSGEKAIDGYGTLVVKSFYDDNTTSVIKQGNFFQDRSYGSEVKIFDASDVLQAGKKLTKVTVYIAFEIEHAAGFIGIGAKYSNWLYKFTLPIIQK